MVAVGCASIARLPRNGLAERHPRPRRLADIAAAHRVPVGGSLAYGAYLVWCAVRAGQHRPSGEAILLGAVTNFFDTLGIGSFAPSIAWIRFRRLVPDRLVPLTMLGGYILPSIVQAIGGIVGVPVAVRAPVRLVQGVVGLALLVAGVFWSR